MLQAHNMISSHRDRGGEELKKKYHEAKQAKGTSNKDKNHLLKKWAKRDVEKPALLHQSPSSEKNACHKLVNNKTLVKRKDNLCDTKRKPAPKKKTLVDTEST